VICVLLITQTLGDLLLFFIHCAEQEEAFVKWTKVHQFKRGQYVDRNENLLPMLHRGCVTQDFSIKMEVKE
jgi:hypothetical protein